MTKADDDSARFLGEIEAVLRDRFGVRLETNDADSDLQAASRGLRQISQNIEIHQSLTEITQSVQANNLARVAQMTDKVFDAHEELKRTQAELIQAQKIEALGMFASGIVHDFNNMLGIILGNANLFLRRQPETAEGRQYVETIMQTGEHAAALVQQILAFSRSDTAMLGPIDIGRTVADALKSIRTTLPTRIELS